MKVVSTDRHSKWGSSRTQEDDCFVLDMSNLKSNQSVMTTTVVWSILPE